MEKSVNTLSLSFVLSRQQTTTTSTQESISTHTIVQSIVVMKLWKIKELMILASPFLTHEQSNVTSI
jgi:hypothetical protein